MATLRASLDGETQNADETLALRVSDIVPPPQPESATSAQTPRAHTGRRAYAFAIAASAFWLGAAAAYLWGYFGREGLAGLDLPLLVFAGIVAVVPPLLFVAFTFALVRARAMGDAARELMQASLRLSEVDENAVTGALRLGRAVRRELDALNAGVDGAFGRLRALQTALEERVTQLEEAGARASVKAEGIAQRLRAEREAIDSATAGITQSATLASETLASRAAQLKTLIESAGGELRVAGETLDSQSAKFREAAEKAANAPQQAALELDRQAKQIETAAENAVARAEFVLARQERQRTALNELLAGLRDEAGAFEQALAAQRSAVERAAMALAGEAQRLNALSEQGLRQVDTAMASANARAVQFTADFGREADKLKESTEATTVMISRIVDTMREAGVNATSLIADATAEAKRHANDLVDEAMGQCDHLLRAATNVAEQAEKARAVLVKAAEDAERHIVALPGIATQEATRVRETLRNETEQLLDVSARALAALRNRAAAAKQAAEERNEPTGTGGEQGLRNMARRITGARRREDEPPRNPQRGFHLSDVLAAADGSHTPGLRAGAAASLGALETVLADLAVDLDALLGDGDDPALWRRYLEGDRGAFARHLAKTITPETVDRIAALYRDNGPFREAANAYLQDFEALLARARESDADGFLASTLLTADTGKIFLTVAYSLGRLS